MGAHDLQPLWIFFLLKLFYCISFSLFHLFPFLFYSFCVFTFFLVYVCSMFLFFLFLFCLSSFFSIFMYLFIYLFCFYFFFKKILVFLLYIYLFGCKFEVCTARRPPRRLMRAASRSSGRVFALAALPCLALSCLVTTDRHHCCFNILDC